MRATGGVSPPVASRRLLLTVASLLLLVTSCSEASESTTTSTTSQLPQTTAEQPTPPGPLDVQGHRGARGLQPENTLPAFETALDIGVTTLELDLHFTADGQVVIWHDPIVPPEKCELEGAGTDPGDDATIASFNRDELRAYRCARNPDPGRFPDQSAEPTAIAGDDYSIATLDELFEFVATYSESDQKTAEQRATADAVLFNIETKRIPDRPDTINDGFDGITPGPFETAILDAIAAADLGDRVTIQSFDHRSLTAIRSVDDSIQLAALTRRNEPFETDFATFAQIWSPDYRSLSASSLNEAQAAGMLVIPWTVNETSDMNRLIELGVDGLITDRPDLLVQEIAGRQ
ncbi:MAG: hypothetical protein HKN91_11360 [Acidimicrobiia bacterium]|nr:hypothetical protein [Acidimicrobiia bacterium]